MRVNDHFEQLEERIRKLEKEVAALKAGSTTVTVESAPIGTLPVKKTAAKTAKAKAAK